MTEVRKLNDPERVIIDGWATASTDEVVTATIAMLNPENENLLEELEAIIRDFVEFARKAGLGASEYLGYVRRHAA